MTEESASRAGLTDGEVRILQGYLRNRVNRLARRGIRWGIDPDDILQEGLMAAWRSLENYRVDFGMTRISWACKKGRYALIDAVRESRNLLGQSFRSRQRIGATARVVSLSGRCSTSEIERTETIAVAGREDWPENAVQRAFEDLRLDLGMSERNKAIAVAVWCEGLTMTEAAEKFEITQSRTCQILNGLRTRILAERSNAVGEYANRPGLKKTISRVGIDVAARSSARNARGPR